MSIPVGRTETIELVCPVLPGRRAVRHQWIPRPHNYIDSAVPHSKADGLDIPDAGLDYYRGVSAGDLFQQARDDWAQFYNPVTLELPDTRWTDFAEVMGQAREAQQWRQLADQFLAEYDQRFGENFAQGLRQLFSPMALSAILLGQGESSQPVCRDWKP